MKYFPISYTQQRVMYIQHTFRTGLAFPLVALRIISSVFYEYLLYLLCTNVIARQPRDTM